MALFLCDSPPSFSEQPVDLKSEPPFRNDLARRGLLQVDVHELLSAPSPEERIIPGFSWCPRSLMSGAHVGKWWSADWAVCTSTWLLAYCGYLLHSEPMELNEKREYVVHDVTQSGCSYFMQPIVLMQRPACRPVRGSEFVVFRKGQ